MANKAKSFHCGFPLKLTVQCYWIFSWEIPSHA